MIRQRIQKINNLEYLSSVAGLLRRRKNPAAQVGSLCAAWLETQPLVEHLAVMMTTALVACGFQPRYLLQLGLHHGPFPAFSQVQPYPQELLRQVPTEEMNRLFGMSGDPLEVLNTYADALRDHWRASRFQGVEDAVAPATGYLRWADCLPDGEIVRKVSTYLQRRPPAAVNFVPLAALSFTERYGIVNGDSDEETLFLIFGAPGEEFPPQRITEELAAGLEYHLVARPVAVALDRRRNELSASEALQWIMGDKGLLPRDRDWYRIVMRSLVYAINARLNDGQQPPETLFASTPGTPFHLVPWFYDQVLAVEHQGKCDVEELTAFVVANLEREQSHLQEIWTEAVDFPGCIKACFIPFWQRRKTIVVVPPTWSQLAVKQTVAQQWHAQFPSISAEDWTRERHGDCNLILYGPPEANQPLGLWLQEEGKGATARRFLNEEFKRGRPFIAADRSPWQEGAWIYAHAVHDTVQMAPYSEASFTEAGFIVLRGNDVVHRGHW